MATTKRQNGPKVPPVPAKAAQHTQPKSQSKPLPKFNTSPSRNEKETMPMGKMNYILMGVSLFLIVLGFILMTGSSNEGSEFNSDVFSSKRIVVAPIITFFGFLAMIPAILYKGKDRKEDDDDVPPELPKEGPTSNVVTNSNIIVKNK